MRRVRTGLVTFGLAAGLALIPAKAVAAPDVTGPEPAGSVTLITGDRVELRGDGSPPHVRLGPGRMSVPVRVTRRSGHLRVLPADAAALIAAGRLDERLFDVTTLLEHGYDDAARPDLPLIVQYDAGTPRPALAAATAVRELPSVGGAAVNASKKDTRALWDSFTQPAIQAGITKIWLNGKRKPTLDHSVPQIGAPAAWQAGLTGSGVPVAVIDTGVDATHPDLAGKVVASANFTGEPAGDRDGHGTHVASTVTGSGAVSGGRYRGVAPGARLLDAKVCTDRGCDDDAILAAMEWSVIEQHARVVNLSLGAFNTAELDPLEQAVNTLSAQYGALFVVAAGNAGPFPGTIDSPGSADAALTVGAVDRTDTIADFSARGPRTGDGAVKPDVTAPGVDIVAARADGTQAGEVVDERYVRLSGTSMATPHVAGAAAILVQQHPEWTGEQVKAALMSSAHHVEGSGAFEQGAGRVDVARAITAPVTATPSSVGLGLALWPHEDDQPLSETVSYRNAGSAEVTLDLSVRATHTDGNPAPAELFTVSPSRVVVAPGASASVTVTANTRPASVPIGHYAGWLVAGELFTPIEVGKEAERYQVNLTHIGRDGNAPGLHVTYLDQLGTCASVDCGGFSLGSSATSAMRLPPGKYTLGDFSITAERKDLALLMRPVLELNRDTAVTLDARQARPVDLAVPRKSARLMEWNLNVGRDVLRPGDALVYSVGGDDSLPVFTGDLGGESAGDGLVSFVQGRFAEPGPNGDYVDSPYEYGVGDGMFGRLFTGLRLHPAQREFATVETTIAAVTSEPRSVLTRHFAVPANARQDLLSWPPNFDAKELISTRMPMHRTEFYLAKGLKWSSYILMSDPARNDFILLSERERQSYRAGRTYHQTWGKGVFGPQFREPVLMLNGNARGVVRKGDHFAAGIDLFVDSDPRHAGEPRVLIGTGKLYRDGQLMEDWPFFGYVTTELPPQVSTYRLEATTAQTFADVSTKVTSAWTFRSGHVDGTEAAALPLLAVRYRPELDDRNHANPGRVTVPIDVARQPGAGKAFVKSVTVEVSYDEGASWKPAPVTRHGFTWCATLDNPKGGAVSLRTRATDTDGNRLEQTTIRAYLVN